MRKLAGALAALALAVTACGGGGDGGTGTGGGGKAEATLSIQEPSDAASVEVPFTMTFASDVELGPTDTGAMHVHVWFDGNADEYEVIESDTFEVQDLPPGDHTITASLRNADHSSAGAEHEITVTVAGGAGGGGGGKEREEDDAGYGY